ncbi:hypothetical protein F4806DRAFT_472976 [Annulohypoxylon nitens]|nr:hypothetical protein F4806DRAFT_472976 [Annulohypoxylon nitens]
MSQSSAVQVPVLTPSFIPASSCTQDIYFVVNQDVICNNARTSSACAYFHLGPTTSTSACFPTSWSPRSGAYISPGGCPSGYTVACAYTEAPESTATCCPSGFSCQTDQFHELSWRTSDICFQEMTSSVAYQYTISTAGQDPETSATSGVSGQLNAYGVAIRWNSSDLTAASTSTPTGSIRGLSQGAKAAIGVGAAIAGILILVGAFLLWRRSRRHRKEEPVVVYDQLAKGLPELSEDRGRAELCGKSLPSELPNYRERVELPEQSLPAELGPGRE